jgi:hypothetical protein
LSGSKAAATGDPITVNARDARLPIQPTAVHVDMNGLPDLAHKQKPVALLARRLRRA